MRRFYSLPQSSRDVLYNLFDNMLKLISTTKKQQRMTSVMGSKTKSRSWSS